MMTRLLQPRRFGEKPRGPKSHMKRAAGVCPPLRGTRYAAGGGGGGFGGLGGSMGQLQFNSLAHLVGQGEQLVRNLKAKRLRSVEIEHKLELRGPYDRKFARLLTLENPAGIDASLAIGFRDGSHSSLGRRRRHIRATDRVPRQTMMRCQHDDALPMGIKERAGPDK
jgi:hypothetical protein